MAGAAEEAEEDVILIDDDDDTPMSEEERLKKDLERQLRIQRNATLDAYAKLAAATATEQDALAANSTLANKRDALEAEIKQLKLEHKKKLDEVSAELKEAIAKEEKAIALSENLAQKYTSLASEKAEPQKRLDEKSEQLKIAQANVETALNLNKKLEQDKATLAKEIDELRMQPHKRLDEISTQLQDAKASEANALTLNRELTSQNNDLKTSEAELKKRLTELSTQLEEAAKAKEMKVSYELTNAKANEQKALAVNGELARRYEALKETEKAQQKRLDEISAKLGKVSKEKDKALTLNGELTRRLALKDDTCKGTESAHQKRMEKISANLEVFRIEKDDALTLNSALTVQNEALKAEQANQQKRTAEMQQKLSQVPVLLDKERVSRILSAFDLKNVPLPSEDQRMCDDAEEDYDLRTSFADSLDNVSTVTNQKLMTPNSTRVVRVKARESPEEPSNESIDCEKQGSSKIVTVEGRRRSSKVIVKSKSDSEKRSVHATSASVGVDKIRSPVVKSASKPNNKTDDSNEHGEPSAKRSRLDTVVKRKPDSSESVEVVNSMRPLRSASNSGKEDDAEHPSGKKSMCDSGKQQTHDSSDSVDVESRRRSSKSVNKSDAEKAIETGKEKSQKDSPSTNGISRVSKPNDLECPLIDCKTGYALRCECGDESFSASHRKKKECSIANFTVIRKTKEPKLSDNTDSSDSVEKRGRPSASTPMSPVDPSHDEERPKKKSRLEKTSEMNSSPSVENKRQSSRGAIKTPKVADSVGDKGKDALLDPSSDGSPLNPEEILKLPEITEKNLGQYLNLDAKTTEDHLKNLKLLTKYGAVRNTQTCTTCGEAATLSKDLSRMDGYRWKCTSHFHASPRAGSLFSTLSKPVVMSLLAAATFIADPTIQLDEMARVLGSVNSTVKSYENHLLDAIQFTVTNRATDSVGGPNKIVDVEQCMLYSEKYSGSVDRAFTNCIILLERGSPNYSIVKVKKAIDAVTLADAAAKHVRNGSKLSSTEFTAIGGAAALQATFSKRHPTKTIKFHDFDSAPVKSAEGSKWNELKEAYMGAKRKYRPSLMLTYALKRMSPKPLNTFMYGLTLYNPDDSTL